MKTNEEILQDIQQTLNILDEVEEYQSTLNDQLSLQDMKLSDLRHLIEFNNLNAASSCSVIKEIKNVLNTRRIIKDNMDLLKVYQMHISKLNNSSNRKMLLSELFKKQKTIDNATYYNRVYSAEEFDKFLGKKVKEDEQTDGGILPEEKTESGTSYVVDSE